MEFTASMSSTISRYVRTILRQYQNMAQYDTIFLYTKKMSKADLRKAAGLAPNTMTKLRKDEPVAMGVLKKIFGTVKREMVHFIVPFLIYK